MREEPAAAATIGNIESAKQGDGETSQIQSIQDQGNERAALDAPTGKKSQYEHPFETGDPKRDRPESPIGEKTIDAQHLDKLWKIQRLPKSRCQTY